MKVTIDTKALWLTGELEAMNRHFVQIICTNVDSATMADLYRYKANVLCLPSGKLAITIDREDILSLKFLDKED
jgi:hypothetical protein